MWVVPVLSAVFALSGLVLVFAAIRLIRTPVTALLSRDRFFKRFFRAFGLVGCVLGALLLFKAAWLVWVSPTLSVMYVMGVPVLAVVLLITARAVLPWFYQRRNRR